MSIFKVRPEDVESFTVVTNPWRTYTSGTSGVTGSVYIFARRSAIEKETQPLPAFIDSVHDDADIDALLTTTQRNVHNAAIQNAYNVYGTLLAYMDGVTAQGSSQRKASYVDVERFTPSYTFTKNTVRKLVVKEVLDPHYRTVMPSAQWACTNYNTLNFFTASSVPSSGVLLYPNVPSTVGQTNHVTGTYCLSGAFSLDFYVNPRYRQDQGDTDYHAGTILHLTSSYAVSLISGSLKDENGRAAAFRVQLQLSHSADVKPSLAKPGAKPNDLTFLSDDNSLEFNRWHHVIVRWGTSVVNEGTGSFLIDSVERGTFVIPSATLAPLVPSMTAGPDVLCVGNFYEGSNAGTSAMAYFFADDPATREGLETLINDVHGIDEPTRYVFDHPLNAELHDLCIKRYYMNDLDVIASASKGISAVDDRIAMYVPPFFTYESPLRQSVAGYGGVMQTPFFEVDGSTFEPFNVAMSFGVGGHYMNLENYVRDFANGTYPRLLKMSASVIAGTTDAEAANAFLYTDENVRRRNLTVLPCDDGCFVPNHELLRGLNATRFVDDLGTEDLSLINLDDLTETGSLVFGTLFEGDAKTFEEGDSFPTFEIGFTPETPGIDPGPAFTGYSRLASRTLALSGTVPRSVATGAPLTIYQRTRDSSSNEVTFFNVSNIFYGKRIMPGSLTIADAAVTGSNSVVRMTLCDDGYGNLYRADCLTSASTWCNVGNVYYDEGVLVIKNPSLYFFGVDGYELSFRGTQGVHVLHIDTLVPANALNSSSNPNYVACLPSGISNDPDTEFVYVTGINYHDDNLNVVMKTQLAQPLVKRFGAKFLVKNRVDF